MGERGVLVNRRNSRMEVRGLLEGSPGKEGCVCVCVCVCVMEAESVHRCLQMGFFVLTLFHVSELVCVGQR